ncbi:MAG: NapC/NirT family cytochrome c [Geminicoccaceae bacterium]
MTNSALVRHPLTVAGAVMATVSAVAFILLALALAVGMFHRNPYAGLIVFVTIPALFVLGLLLIPLGIRLQRRRLRDHPERAGDWPVLDFRRPEVRRRALLFTALTAVNVIVITLAGYSSLHWMESPSFCGQVCHTPMQPQFTAWQAAAHQRVACVECHIGEGVGGFVHAKLSGVRQLVNVVTNRVPKPIPPGAHMEPGAQGQTCTGCHDPGRIAGDRLRVVHEYADDEANTETTTVLQLHVGASPSSARAIHWHASPGTRVEYVSTDAGHQTIPYVRVTNADGTVKEYKTAEATDQIVRSGERRTMDCIDCHNTVGHPIAPTPEIAVDRAIARAQVSRQLPFVRREAVKLMTASYPSQEAGTQAIGRGLEAFYASRGGAPDQQAIARTVTALQTLYGRNVFPTMKVSFGSYPDHRGHTTSNGCFRCHDESHTAADGSTISGDCEYCHKQLENPL